MRQRLIVGTLVVLAVSLLGVRGATTTAPATAPAVTAVTFTEEWTDRKRNNRVVPVRVYDVAGPVETPRPVILYSHGLGGSRDGYAYLGKHWAEKGYVVVMLQHAGSDREIVKGTVQERMAALQRAAANPMNAIERARDVSFAIDRLTELNKTHPRLKGRLDLERIGLSGHSFGGNTTLLAGGMTVPRVVGNEVSYADKRLKALIAMSPPAPKRLPADAMKTLTLPLMVMTGTLDDSPIGETVAADRRVPYDHAVGAQRYLLIFDGGDHAVFSSRGVGGGASRLPGWGGDRKQDAAFQAIILRASTAFWDAHLRGDKDAATFLSGKGFAAYLGKRGTWETKAPDAK